MKTHHSKLLKKELLIVEIPEDTQFDILVKKPLWKDGIKFLTGKEEEFYFIVGSYTLLGSPDEIREEYARPLVKQSIHTGLFAHYVKDIPVNTYCYKTAKESLLSAIETVIHWDVNPFGEYDKINWFKASENTPTMQEWNEAETITFDRKRSIILIKN